MAYALADDNGWVCEDHDDHHGSTASERAPALPQTQSRQRPYGSAAAAAAEADGDDRPARHAELTEPAWRRLSGNCCYCTTADPVKPEPAPPMILLVP
jgi:hypothetical protein